MLRHCMASMPLTRCCGGRSYMTLVACSSVCRPLIQRPCLLVAGGASLPLLSQTLPWRCASHRLLFDKHCFPALSKVVLSPVPKPPSWHQISKRQKNVYYGFSSGKPKPMSTFGKIYLFMLTAGLFSITLTPLYVSIVSLFDNLWSFLSIFFSLVFTCYLKH